jgi:hypothetical protein
MAEDVVPLRPRFAPTTQTVSLGTLQYEAGVAVDPGDRVSLPVTLRLGVSPRSEAYVGGDLYRREEDPVRQGTGDLVLGIRHRFLESEGGSQAVAVQLQAKLPVSDDSDGFGSGETDLHLALIGDARLGTTLASVFADAGFLGKPGDSGTEFAGTLAGSLQQPLGPRWSGYVEALYQDIHGFDQTGGYLGAGLHWHTTPQSAWDIGVAGGYGDSPEAVMLFLGYSRNAGAFYLKQ